MKRATVLLLLCGASVFALSDPSGERTIKLHGDLAFVPAGSVTDHAATNQRVVFLAETETGAELLSAPVDGSAGQIMLNAPLVAGGAATEFVLAPDGSRALYRADQDVNNQFELYVVPVDGSQAPIKLSGLLGSDRDVHPGIALTPDGSRALYRADADTDQRQELFSVPVDGSAPPVKLNNDGDFINGDFKITPDSTRVVFRTGSSVSIAEVDGSAPPAPLTSLGSINRMTLSPDSTRAVYRTTRTAGVEELFSLLLDGSAPETRLNDPLVQAGDVHDYAITPDGTRVVYLADQDVDAVSELYSVPIAGGSVDKLNPPVDPTQLGVTFFEVAPNSTEVAFKLRQNDMVRDALFRAPVDASAAAIQLTGNITQSEEPRISLDSSRVLYIHFDGAYRLYSVPMDGSAAPLEISAPLGVNEGVSAIHLPPAGADVAYGIYSRQLFIVPIDGSTQAVQLVRTTDDHSSEIKDVQFTPDAARLVFRGDADVNDLDQAYSVPLDASAPFQALNDPLYEVEVGRVGTYVVSSDGQRAVYLASGNQHLVMELYSVPLDGSAPPVKLNPDPVEGGDVNRFAVSPDSSFVVFQADLEVDDVFELYSTPIDGSLPAVKLNEPLPPDADVGLGCTCHGTYFSVSPDSSRVVFYAYQFPPDVAQLWSVPIDGSTGAVLLGSSQVTGSAPTWVFSPDSSLVAYSMDQDIAGACEVFSVPADGSATAMKLNPDLPAGRFAREVGFSPDSSTVVYISDQAVDGKAEIYSVPADASAPEIRLSAINPANGDVSEVKISSSGRVVYEADQEVDDRIDLYSVELNGTGRLRLSDVPTSGGDVNTFELTPDGTGAVFFGDVRVDGLFELFYVPIGLAGAQTRISADIVDLGAIRSWRISPDSSRVVYNGDVEQNTWWRLYSVPTTGGPVTRINGPLIFPGDVQALFEISPDSSYVLYRADQDVNERMELYAVPIDGRSTSPFSLKANVQHFDDAIDFAISRDSMRVVYRADDVANFREALFRTDVVPRATSVAPALGPLEGGNTITIRGCGFTGEAEVRIGGNLAPEVTFVSASELRVTVPASSGRPQQQTGPPAGRLRRAVLPRLTVGVEVSVAGIGSTLEGAYTYAPSIERRVP